MFEYMNKLKAFFNFLAKIFTLNMRQYTINCEDECKPVTICTGSFFHDLVRSEIKCCGIYIIYFYDILINFRNAALDLIIDAKQ